MSCPSLCHRPALCYAHKDETAALCVEPPVVDGVIRCSLCGEGTGRLREILARIAADAEHGGRTTRTSLGRDLNLHTEAATLARYLAELAGRGFLILRPRKPLLLTDEGRAAARRAEAGEQAEIEALMDAEMACSARPDDDGVLGDLAADAARERRMFGGTRLGRW